MRLNFILMAVVVLLGLALSFVLIPREKDVALLKLRSDETDEARKVLLAQYDSGDRSVQVIDSLARIAVSDGEIPTAVQLLENYVADNPKDLSGLRRLAEYYRFDQRRDDYVRTIATVVQLDGTDAERRLLADLYRLRGNYEALLPALNDLIERKLASHPQYLETARLAASARKFDQSLAALQQMWRNFDWSFEANSVRLFVMVAAAAGKTDQAQDVIARLASGEKGAAAIVPVIQQVADRGQPKLGLSLLSQFESDLHKTPPLLVAWARMQMALEQEAVALERLLALEDKGELPELAFPVLLDLALTTEDIDLIVRLVQPRDMGTFADFRLRAVSDNAIYWRHHGLLEQMMAQAAPKFLEQHPALVAEAMVELGRPELARKEAARARLMVDPRIYQLMRLARAEIKLDELDNAAKTLARIARHPDLDAQATRALATLFVETQRTKEGLAAFERLRKVRPSLMAEAGWARMAAREGKEAELLAWFDQQQALERDLLADIVYLGAAGPAPKSALVAARRLYREHPDRESSRLYADALIANGRYSEAVPIMEELLPGSSEEAETYVAALEATGEKAKALQFLIRRGKGEALPTILADDLMALAIELDQSKLAYDEARRQDLKKFDEDTIASVAENAAEDGDFELVDLIVEQVGEGFMAARPVMSARIELARGNEKLAREWAEAALASTKLRNTETLILAKVWDDLGETEISLELLEKLAKDPITPAFAMTDLSAQYLKLGKAKQGVPVFRELISRRNEAQVQEGWARVETKAGTPARVLKWLKGAEAPTRQVLADIYYLADARKARKLSFAAAERLHERYPGDEARLIWGRALTQAGRGREAVPILQPLLPGGAEVRAAYVAALGQGGKAKDLRAFATDALKDPDLDPEVRSALLFALLEGGGADLALPRLRQLAKDDPKQWEAAYLDALRKTGSRKERVAIIERKLRAAKNRKTRDALLFELLETGGPARALPWLKRVAEAEPESEWPATYETALAKLGRNDDLVAWLTAKALNTAKPAKARREAAFRLLDLGARRPAERAFLSLAAKDGPKSENVQQLLYLWGPRPPQRGLDWLEGRARGSASKARGGWLQLLANAGAHERVAALGFDPVPVDANDPALRPLIEALIKLGRRDEVADIVGPIIPLTSDPKQLLRLADWAEQARATDVAVDAYRRAVSFIDDDAAALLKAARTFVFSGRPELARDTVERFFRVADSSYDDNHRPWYYHGLAHALMNRNELARESYREMLARMDRNGAEDFESRRMRAVGYEAIGEGDKAVDIYQQLLAERPRDRSLVADYASLLIELKRYEQAELLLSQN